MGVNIPTTETITMVAHNVGTKKVHKLDDIKNFLFKKGQWTLYTMTSRNKNGGYSGGLSTESLWRE